MDRLTSGRIVVRQAGEIRKFVTLDGVERELAPEDLLICDGETPIALAGVMGGMDSEVRAETSRVFLESAHFDPATVRRTAKRLGLRSEASHRFERGVDEEGTIFALDRAVFLLNQNAQGAPLRGVIDRYPRRAIRRPIVLRAEAAKKVLGVEIKPAEIEKTMRAVGGKVRGRPKGAVKIVPPSYRRDLSREADLIEELARLRGFGNIPSTLPLVRARGRLDLYLRWERRVRSLLTGEGLTEVKNLSFSSAEMNRRFFGLGKSEKKPVPVLNPLDRESSEMRLSLIPGLVRNLRAHIDQKFRSLHAFELGKAFSLEPAAEAQHLAGLLYGRRERQGLRATENPLAFLDIKGLVEGILELNGLDRTVAWISEGVPPFLHPGQAAWVKAAGKPLGYLGTVHPDLCEEIDLPPFFIFELDFEKWVQYAPRQLTVRSIPKFPAVERDLAVVVDESFPAQEIVNWVHGLRNSIIEAMRVFDEYRGPPIPEGKKNLAYTISYRAEDRTLTDTEVSDLHQDLVSRIGQVFGAQLRQ
jgi:phenylalanyl-tRNA synthetase beta chain